LFHRGLADVKLARLAEVVGKAFRTLAHFSPTLFGRKRLET
jgi:hypothetical protein